MSLRALLIPLAAVALMAVAGPHPGVPPGLPGTAPDRLSYPLWTDWVMTQPYGCTGFLLEPPAPWCPTGHLHTGIDMAVPAGTPVHAAAAGVARVAENPGGYGLYVVVDHGAGLSTLYAHLESASVPGAAAVAAGQEIGQVGSTGLSTGPHLHFEVRRSGRPVDPAPWLPPR